MYSGLLDVGNGMLDAAGEGVHGAAVLPFLAASTAASAAFHDTGPFRAEISTTSQPSSRDSSSGVDLVAVLADDVHHVDGDDHGDAQLGQLGGQVEVTLELVPSMMFRMASGRSPIR